MKTDSLNNDYYNFIKEYIEKERQENNIRRQNERKSRVYKVHLCEIENDDKPYYINQKDKNSFFQKDQTILVTEVPNTLYVKEVLTGMYFPIVNIETRRDWDSYKLKFGGKNTDCQYVISVNNFLFTEKITPDFLKAYFSLDPNLVKQCLKPSKERESVKRK